MNHFRKLTSIRDCSAGRATPEPEPRTAWVPKNIHRPGQSTATPRKSSTHTQRTTLPPLLSNSGVGMKQETVQILETQAGSCSRLDEMQYNEDANKRTCSLPTHCLPTPPGHISDTQPVIPMEREGTSEQRVHAAAAHTQRCCLFEHEHRFGFSFFFGFYFLEKFTLKTTPLPDTHLLCNQRDPESINRGSGV